MKRKAWTIITATVFVLVAAGLIVWKNGGSEERAGQKAVETAGTHAMTVAPPSKKHGARSASREAVAETGTSQIRSLDLPAEKLIEGSKDELTHHTTPQRSSGPMAGDEILMAGQVLPKAAKSVVKTGNPTGGPRSLKSEEWQGAANLLVNALRAGDRFEVNQDELMDFLRGKDLLGWPESYRNWIGDELMTALRQDMPEVAFESLKSIEADTTAPAAMRDYSVQHISHLVTGGVIGQEGADHIWATLTRNDPQTLSTALISLHRLSEQVPDLVSENDVRAAAERLKDHPDERTRITAGSILGK